MSGSVSLESSTAAQEAPQDTTAGVGAARRSGLYGLMVLSGFAGLGYEMVWTRALSVSLGHEIVAVLAVVAAFFAGVAVGAWLLDGPVRRSHAPGKWYAALELIIGLWALVLIPALPWFNQTVVAVLGLSPAAWQQWLIAFAGTFLLLAPATIAMGATLPAMERLLVAWGGPASGIAGLYAANTLGAVLGTMVTVAALVPLFGVTNTFFVLAGANVCCAVGLLASGGTIATVSAAPASLPQDAPGPGRLGGLLIATGVLGIGFEVLVIRVLAGVLENTVFTFASLLSVYLLGTAIGAAVYARVPIRWPFDRVLGWLLSSLSAAVLISGLLLYTAPAMHLSLTRWVGDGYVAAINGEILMALAVFAMPTVIMGALFSHLIVTAQPAFGIGRALGLNTLAAATAPLLFGVLLLPILGAKLLLVLIAAGYVLLLPRFGFAQPRLAATGVMLVVAFGVVAPALRHVTVPEEGRLVSYTDGVMASVAVVADAGDVHYLKVNDHFTMGSSATGYSDQRQSHLPLLLHPAPTSALYLGLGTGSTIAAVADHPGLAATGVELIPEVIPAMQYFDPRVQGMTDAGRLTIVASDARRFVQASDERFDVIIGEVFHPSRDGAGALYTVEHFSVIRERLNNGGLFAQWLPLFQLDLETLATIIRTFQSVYPDTEAYLAHLSLGQPIIALVGRASPRDYERGWVRTRVRDRQLAAALTQVDLTSDFDLFGLFLGSGEALRDFAGQGPLNKDDRPVVTYQAPGFVYAAPEPAHARLLQLVSQLKPASGQLLKSLGPRRDEFGPRLQRYWQARDQYLTVGVRVVPAADPLLMLRQLREPLLGVLEISEDFTPAYRPLVELAYQLAATDNRAAVALLDEVIAVTPSRPQARQLRAQLLGSGGD